MHTRSQLCTLTAPTPSLICAAALYTSSWAAPKADVHSQQRFFYMGHAGEVKVDQAHRGYTQATDASGFASLNPLYMRYTPNSRGEFCGQAGYGYQRWVPAGHGGDCIGTKGLSTFQLVYCSFEAFVKAVADIQAGRTAPSDYDDRLPTIGTPAAGWFKVQYCVTPPCCDSSLRVPRYVSRHNLPYHRHLGGRPPQRR